MQVTNATVHHDHDVVDIFGFWLYILTDCILFSCLFAVYIVLQSSHLASSLKNYVNLNDIFIETIVLLTSNFTFCLATISLQGKNIRMSQCWLFATLILGGIFLYMEFNEFSHLFHAGFRWDVTAHASAFYTLVGTHGLHVSIGLIWLLILMTQLSWLIKTAPSIASRRITIFGLFWNFLDIIWIFVFTIVYLAGVI